jgi:hypothetical protein
MAVYKYALEDILKYDDTVAGREFAAGVTEELDEKRKRLLGGVRRDDDGFFREAWRAFEAMMPFAAWTAVAKNAHRDSGRIPSPGRADGPRLVCQRPRAPWTMRSEVIDFTVEVWCG